MDTHIVEPSQVPLVVYIMLSVIMILVSVVGYFLMRQLDKFDSVEKSMAALEKSIVRLETNFENFEKDISYVERLRADFKNDMEQVVILKRDQGSLWRKVDELRMKIGEMR